MKWPTFIIGISPLRNSQVASDGIIHLLNTVMFHYHICFFRGIISLFWDVIGLNSRIFLAFHFAMAHDTAPIINIFVFPWSCCQINIICPIVQAGNYPLCAYFQSWIIQSWNLVFCVVFHIVSGWKPHTQHNRHLRCRKWSSSSDFRLTSCQASWWNEQTNAELSHICTYTYIHWYARTSVYMHAHMHMHMHMRMHMYLHIYIYVYIYINVITYKHI